MLIKIAAKTIRQQWRDYLVLLLGTTVAVAIFYMFSVMATNDTFLKGNASMKLIVPVFMLGEVLLGLITFVYLNFANNFLLKLRQQEYGLFSMLGATKRQIGTLLMEETLLVGSLATIIGILIGMGLTGLSANFFMQLIDVKLAYWAVVTPQALVVTVLFFLIVFVLNGLYNRWRLMRQDTLTLLTANRQAGATPVKAKGRWLKASLGLLLLAGSYGMMTQLSTGGLFALILALILNVGGTYLFIGQTLNLLTAYLQTSRFGQRGLRAFVNGQLRFRLPEYKRMLTMIAVVFGMALGAISVGQGYYITLPKLAAQSSGITVATRADSKALTQLKAVDYQATVHYVNQGDKTYLLRTDLGIKVPTAVYQGNQTRLTWQPTSQIEDANANATLSALGIYVNPEAYTTNVILTDQLPKGTVKTISMVRTAKMDANRNVLNQLYQQEQEHAQQVDLIPGTYGTLKTLKGLFGGLEFMSLFLGIAFMIMLASTLMFKTLASVGTDRQRYTILTMLGTTRGQRLRAMMTDLGILFSIPMGIGLLDVGFGLQMFKDLMSEPYAGLGGALVMMLSLYIFYYGLTVFIYRRLMEQPKN